MRKFSCGSATALLLASLTPTIFRQQVPPPFLTPSIQYSLTSTRPSSSRAAPLNEDKFTQHWSKPRPDNRNEPPSRVVNLRNTKRRLGEKFDPDYRPPKKPSPIDFDRSKYNNSNRADSRGANTSKLQTAPKWIDGKSKQQQLSSKRLQNLFRGAKIESPQLAQQATFRSRVKSLLDKMSIISKDAKDFGHKEAGKKLDQALQLLETEMKVLRVMIKDKNPETNPTVAWISASRLKSPYNIAMSIAMNAGRIETAFKLLNQMKKEGIFPSAGTYNVLFTALMRNPMVSDARRQEDARKIFEEVEALWKEALPETWGPDAPRAKSETKMVEELLDEDLSPQARRNLQSKQASIMEIRNQPKVLSSAITTYLGLLAHSKEHDKAWRLFERVCPDPAETGLKGKAPPTMLATKFIFSIMVSHVRIEGHRHGIEKATAQLRMLLKRWETLTDLAVAETKEARGQFSPLPVEDQAETFLGSGNKTSQRSIRPPPSEQDDRVEAIMIDNQGLSTVLALLYRIGEEHGNMIFPLLEKYFGFSSEDADGVLKLPRKGESVETDPRLDRIVNAATFASIMRVLCWKVNWKIAVACFNQMWARGVALSEQRNSVQADAQPFGPFINLKAATWLLYALIWGPDATAAKVVFDRMLDFVASAKSAEAKREWVLKSEIHHRCMRCIARSTAKPFGWTARAVEQGTFDPWEMAKTTFASFAEMRKQQIQYAVKGRRESPEEGIKALDTLADYHQYSTMCSFFTVANQVMFWDAERDLTGMSRDCLREVHRHFGLNDGGASFLDSVQKLQARAGLSERMSALRTIRMASVYEDVLMNALKTGVKGNMLAPKDEVEMWKMCLVQARKAKSECAEILRHESLAESSFDEAGVDVETHENDAMPDVDSRVNKLKRKIDHQYLRQSVTSLGGENKLLLSNDDLKSLSKENQAMEMEEEANWKRIGGGRKNAAGITRELERWVHG